MKMLEFQITFSKRHTYNFLLFYLYMNLISLQRGSNLITTLNQKILDMLDPIRVL